VANVAAQYIKKEKPNLCFIHFADSDGAGHKYGWGSKEQIKAFEDEDQALKTVWSAIQKAGIARRSVLILSADHGGHDKTHGSRSPEDMTIPWIAFGSKVKWGHHITVPVTTYDTAATALWLLGVPVPADWDGKPVQSAFKGF
jgi:predicted AlkP superfamily pyrophosphatase or phosphodiesterase